MTKTITVNIPVEVPFVAKCVNCGACDVKHDACHNVNTEYVYDCKNCGHSWYINEGTDKIWTSKLGTKSNRKDSIRNFVGADYYNVSLRGTKWRKGDLAWDGKDVIASVLCECNGKYVVTSERLNLTFPTMVEAEAALLDVLQLNAARGN